MYSKNDGFYYEPKEVIQTLFSHKQSRLLPSAQAGSCTIGLCVTRDGTQLRQGGRQTPGVLTLGKDCSEHSAVSCGRVVRHRKGDGAEHRPFPRLCVLSWASSPCPLSASVCKRSAKEEAVLIDRSWPTCFAGFAVFSGHCL